MLRFKSYSLLILLVVAAMTLPSSFSMAAWTINFSYSSVTQSDPNVAEPNDTYWDAIWNTTSAYPNGFLGHWAASQLAVNHNETVWEHIVGGWDHRVGVRVVADPNWSYYANPSLYPATFWTLSGGLTGNPSLAKWGIALYFNTNVGSSNQFYEGFQIEAEYSPDGGNTVYNYGPGFVTAMAKLLGGYMYNQSQGTVPYNTGSNLNTVYSQQLTGQMYQLPLTAGEWRFRLFNIDPSTGQTTGDIVWRVFVVDSPNDFGTGAEPIPEPASMVALAGVGGCALFGLFRRRRKTA